MILVASQTAVPTNAKITAKTPILPWTICQGTYYSMLLL